LQRLKVFQYIIIVTPHNKDASENW